MIIYDNLLSILQRLAPSAEPEMTDDAIHVTPNVSLVIPRVSPSIPHLAGAPPTKNSFHLFVNNNQTRLVGGGLWLMTFSYNLQSSSGTSLELTIIINDMSGNPLFIWNQATPAMLGGNAQGFHATPFMFLTDVSLAVTILGVPSASSGTTISMSRLL